MSKKTQIDLAQCIAEAISRKGEPKKTANGMNINGFKVIGTVPEHLRHLHNLLSDLGDVVDVAENELLEARKRHGLMREIFFDSLTTHVPDPEDASGIMILKNWDVVAIDDDDRDY